MDRSWIQKSRNCVFRAGKQYESCVNGFLDFAFSKVPIGGKIQCPCIQCINQRLKTRDEVFEHLIVDGIMTGYTVWSLHGEVASSNNIVTENIVVDEDEHEDIVNMPDILQNVFPGNACEEAGSSTTSGHTEGNGNEEEKFRRLMEEAEKELYPGCKGFTKLSFSVALYHIKCLHNWSNKSFSMLLDLLKIALPQDNTLPKSCYETKTMLKDLGLGYNKIDACPNDCMLYWKEASDEKFCLKCGKSRYKSNNKVPEKTLRHFPLIPRLQKLYKSTITSSDMRWHSDGRTNDGRMRHPADAEAWMDFDRRHPTFSADPRNVRLGLASDGFNPFDMKNPYSIWPVVVVPYNLPPWRCMKQSSFMLTLLIPGKKEPGNDIDVYLQPLIDELKLLWDGVNTYDALTNRSFHLRASLLWTINDFPAYANLSGWSTKGALACPCCNKDTMSTWLYNCRKHCYLGHRRFLEQNHKFRKDKRGFNGQVEFGEAPQPLSSTALLAQMEGVEFPAFGKDPNKKRKRARGSNVLPYSWKKKSIFFELPYWQDNLLRHNLDVMHIEKNVCDNVIDTLLEIKDRSKDKLEARLDLQDMNIRPSLHPRRLEGSTKLILPPASHTMSKLEKELFCRALEGLKVPDGYSSNISRYVKATERDMFGMKSHDNHVLMQQLLPLAIRVHPTKNVKLVLLSLCEFFGCLCAKVATKEDLIQLQRNIAETLCNLERIFPPAFFDIMVHILVHLPREVLLGGPVHYRWMYPFERFNKTLKNYVRNKSHPEGSIAEGYIADECMTFCSMHFKDFETKFTRPKRNVDNGILPDAQQHWIFSCKGRTLGGAEMVRLESKEMQQAHRYVLLHYEDIEIYRQLHLEELKRNLGHKVRERERLKVHAEKFIDWFRCHVDKQRQSGEVMSHIIQRLAQGPNREVKKYKGYILNGIRFHTKDREANRRTQNSGVLVTAMTSSYSSGRDMRPCDGNVHYYGVLTEVIELEYSTELKTVLFRCDWAETSERGVFKEAIGFTRVNFNHLMHTGQHLADDPYVFPRQVEQVFYVSDPLNQGCVIALKASVRDVYSMKGDVDEDPTHISQQITMQTSNLRRVNIGDVDISWARTDLKGTTYDATDGS